MKRAVSVGLLLGLTVCQSLATPVAPAGKPLPGQESVINSILAASCLDEERPHPAKVLKSIARDKADLLLMMGDNVYGDYHRNRKVRLDSSLTELQESFEELALRADFQAVRQTHPIMVAWDDHDYGKNDAGGDFAYKKQAEKIHERFWGLDRAGLAPWPGTYYSREFGPLGKRTQVLMLDTRFFRSPLTPTDERNAKGKERYLPSQARHQQMLGEAQWKWLDRQLRRAADVRIIGSSIQVLPTDGHGFESWSRLPNEQKRLLDLIREAGATGVVFVSGDRHRSFLYRRQEGTNEPVVELTASSVNRAFRPRTTETDSAQVGEAYAGENYGEIQIDWSQSVLKLLIRSSDGDVVRQLTQSFPRGRSIEKPAR